MNYDINSVASAMDQKIRQMDYTSNNLANTLTAGFKAEHLRAMEATPDGNAAGDTTVDFRPGLAEKTGQALDLLIEGDGFFVIQLKEGQAFTRRGDFTLDRESRLVTQDGSPVMGESGYIRITKGQSKIQVGADGSVLVDGEAVGMVRIVDFDNRQELSSLGGGLFRDPGTAGMRTKQKPQVVSGFLELSNVNMIREMTEMIEINRSFENYQKIIQTLSEMDKLSVSRIGRLA